MLLFSSLSPFLWSFCVPLPVIKFDNIEFDIFFALISIKSHILRINIDIKGEQWQNSRQHLIGLDMLPRKLAFDAFRVRESSLGVGSPLCFCSFFFMQCFSCFHCVFPSKYPVLNPICYFFFLAFSLFAHSLIYYDCRQYSVTPT